MMEPMPMPGHGKITSSPTYSPVRASLLTLYVKPLYYLGPKGDYLLYKKSGIELDPERIHRGLTPPLFARADERIESIPEMQQQFVKFINTKTSEGKDIMEVKTIISDWVEETFEEMAKGEVALMRTLPGIIDVLLQKYGTNFLAFAKEIPKYDYSTAVHSVNTMAYVVNYFVKQIGMTPDDPRLKTCALSALLHDVGKQKIDQSIIFKPAKLTDEEWRTMQTHPREGYNILRSLQMKDGSITSEVLDAALHHHEKTDGSGYPDGLRGEQISELTEVVALADVFDALTCDERAYRAKMEPSKVFEKVLLPDTRNGKYHTKRYNNFVQSLGFNQTTPSL